MFNKKEKLEIGVNSLIYNPQSIMDFIFKFKEEFNFEIIAIDASSKDRTFKIHYLFYKENIQKDIIIKISSYDENLDYFLETKSIEEVSFRSVYKNQIEFIRKFL